jgi:hypothetical protein
MRPKSQRSRTVSRIKVHLAREIASLSGRVWHIVLMSVPRAIKLTPEQGAMLRVCRAMASIVQGRIAGTTGDYSFDASEPSRVVFIVDNPGYPVLARPREVSSGLVLWTDAF